MSSASRTKFWSSFLGIFFPEACLACGSGLRDQKDISFCKMCRQNVRLIRTPLCNVCGKPFEKSAGENHFCSYCLVQGWHFTQARAAVYYQGPIVEAVKDFKYNGKLYGLKSFTALADKYYLSHLLPEPDLILPVPLHPKRLRKRGFNQALVLSRKIFSKSKGKINPHILERSQWTRPQTGLKRKERKRNVRGAFMVKKTEKIKNKKILLIDDVFTTGATVDECARVLLKNKAAEVEVFTFARSIDRY